MDFGVVGLDHHRHHHHHHNHHGLGISASSSSEAGFGLNNVISSSSSDPETKQRTILYGSGLSCNNTNNIKQERSAGTALEEYWRSSKVAKTGGGGGDGDDFSSVCKGMMFHQRNNNNNNNTLLRSNSNTTTTTTTSTTTLSFLDNEHYNQQQQQRHQMLSFSTSPRSEAHNNATLPYFPNAISAYTTRNTAFNSGSNNNTHGGMMMMRSGGAAFTAAQWMELEHQALIYKYITANIPIPSILLLPIRKAFDSSPFPSSALLRPNPLGVGGWGGFHLGFSNTTDPEPGRCRRTDGKKWRCSRDAVADQKYCERHMNRGRHRSRKPVEGQHGHSVAAGASTNNAAAAAANIKSVALAGGAASNTTLSTAHQQIQSFEINAASNRMFMKDDTTATPNGGLSLLSSKETSSLLFPRKQQIPYDMSSPSSRSSEYGGLVTADHHSLLVNPASQKPPQNDPSPQQSSLHQFIDDWPNKPRPASTAAAAVASCWPESDRTQLSISIPTAETNLSPLRLSRDQSSDANIRQANWIPISWENSLGGPLGEVLHQTNNNSGGGNNNGMMSDHCKSSSSTTVTSSSVLNLMPEGWDNSPPIGSSPTGVLQKTAFGSLSNSSSGSSPRAAEAGSRAHHHNQEGASLSVNIDLLGGSAHLTSSSSLPAL